jgi:uncharacterized protein YndB with AHSA1/START domain
MKKNLKDKITVEVLINASPEKTWQFWTEPTHIVQWNNASDDWHTTKAHNDIKQGGQFNYRMEAKYGSWGFDFAGEYSKVLPFKEIHYTMADNRKVEILFLQQPNGTLVRETFEAETTNPIEMQQSRWQAILNNFKKHIEQN